VPRTPGKNARAVFGRRFGGGAHGERGAKAQSRLMARRSVLDFVMNDARRMQNRLGRSDQEKLDQYLTGVRDIEGRALSAPIVSRFRTRCADDRLGDCPPLPEPWTEPSGPPAGDAGPRPDASVESDAGEDDAGPTPIDAGADVTPVPSCGCTAIGASGRAHLAWLVSLALAAALVRRRR